MLYLFNDSLNVNNQKYLYESVASIITHYSAIASTKQFTDDNYRINNNELKIAISETFTIADAISKNTCIHTLGTNAEYKRVYNIMSYTIQSGFITYVLQVDLWHTYIYDADVRNLFVTRSTRNILHNNKSVGFYPSVKQPYKTPTYTALRVVGNDGTTVLSQGANNEYFNIEKLSVVLAVKVNTFEDQSGATSIVRLYEYTIKQLTDYMHSGITSYFPPLNMFIQEVVGGIYKERHFVGDTLSSELKAQVVNAWIVETECLNVEPTNYSFSYLINLATRTSYEGMYDKNMQPSFVTAGTKSRILKVQNYKNKKTLVGTRFNNIETTPLFRFDTDLTTENEIEIRYVVGADNIKVFAIQGDNQVDITSAFSLNFTQVDGDISLQRQQIDQLQNTLPIVASVGTIAVGAMSYNPIAVGGGILSLANSATRYAEAQLPQRMGNLVRSGDAGTTFFNSTTRCGTVSPSILNPYYRIDIEDDRTGIDEIYEQGLLYNFKIGYLNKLWEFNDVASGQLVPSTIDGYDYLQCSNCTFAGNVPKDAKEYIYNKLLSGIRIQKFSAMQ